MIRRSLLAVAVLSTVGLLGYCALGGGLFCAVSELPTGSEEAAYVTELRDRGPEGLNEALARYDQFVELSARMGVDLNLPRPEGEGDEQVQLAAEGRAHLQSIVDRVAGQRDAWMSRLYWYTDLDRAKAAAAESGKPILSLRMLGQLTDEFSCANSRFFRTALYANESVSRRLRDHFVLHWQSVRPVPRVTIDFGDGRKLERTVTGNSAHYVLDASGQPLDVLPGLYGPQAFESWLERCETLAADCATTSDDVQRSAVLTSYHAARRDAIDAELRDDLVALGARDFLSAQGFGLVAVDELDDETWQRIAALPGHQVVLDERSVATMRRDHPDAANAGRRAMSKAKIEDPLVRMLLAFTTSAALDAVKNEYQLHRQIHEWFVDGSAPADFDALNERVYAELFLTPSSDPWLGLAPSDAYTGLVKGGASTTP